MNDDKSDDWLHKVYGATGTAELKAHYDGWAEDYDADITAYGYTYPAVLAGLAGRYLDAAGGPVLDAGVGTGLMGEILAILGFGELVGIDISDGMLAVAQSKGVYGTLENMVLGEALDFADGEFAAVVSTGVLTVGHAPASALDELVRVTRSGGHLIFSLTVQTFEEDGFKEKIDALEAAGLWRPVETTPEFVALPSAPSEDVAHSACFYVFQRL